MVPSTAEKYKTGEWQGCWDGGDVCSCVLDGQGGLRNKLTFEQICRSRSNSKYKGLRGKIESQIRKLRQRESTPNPPFIYLTNIYWTPAMYQVLYDMQGKQIWMTQSQTSRSLQFGEKDKLRPGCYRTLVESQPSWPSAEPLSVGLYTCLPNHNFSHMQKQNETKPYTQTQEAVVWHF